MASRPLFEKKKLSIDARLNNMGGCSHNLVHLYMCLMAKRFGEALSVEEASKRIRNAVPKTTQYKTMWGIRIFESWKNERANDNGFAELCEFYLHVPAVQNLKSNMLNMTADTLNSWFCKFVQEVWDNHRKTYPEKTVYQLICYIKPVTTKKLEKQR